MKLTFYGTTGAIQTSDNSNVSFSIMEGESSILVDVSGSPAQYLLKTGIEASDLDTLVLTHAHPDHLYGLPSLIHNLWLMGREKPLNIICNPDTENKAKQLIDIFSLLTRKGMFPMEWVSLESGTFERIPRMSITLFSVNHPIPTSGLKITTATSCLVYSADTAPSERVVAEATGAKALIHEATGGERVKKELNSEGHSSAKQAGESAEKAGAEILFLCHFDFNLNPSPDQLQREAQSVFRGKVMIPELFMAYEL